jgi:glycosyltransferase involved in cell wall biosynthesis
VVSSCRALRRVVEEVGGGLVFEAGSPESLADQVLALRDKGLRVQIGSHGHRVGQERYDWRRVTSKKLLDVYSQIAGAEVRPSSSNAK